MDPDEALKQLRAELRDEQHFDAARVAELLDGLDGWLSKGGFPPAAWAERRRTVFVASIDTNYEVLAVATTQDEAVQLVADKAYQHLKAVGALYPETDSPAKVAEYLGVSITAVAVGTAEFVGNE